MISFWDLWKRAKTAPQIAEREFDLKLFKIVKNLVKAYDIIYDSKTIIPEDKTLAKDVLNAALELITNLGILYINDQRIIKVEENEIKECLKKHSKRNICR